MEITIAEKQDPRSQIKVMEDLILDGKTYNYGTVRTICTSLEHTSSEVTSRITTDTTLRQMLLERNVVAATSDYDPLHPWCRFYRGEKFESFLKELTTATDKLEEREPLNNSDPNIYTQWLHGEVWGINPAPDALGEVEGNHPEVSIHSDAEMKTVWLYLGDDPEASYVLEMSPEQAREFGKSLHTLATAVINGTDTTEPSELETEMEVVYLAANRERGTVFLWGDEWADEESGVHMTPSQADELSWQLREQAVAPRNNPQYTNVPDYELDEHEEDDL